MDSPPDLFSLTPEELRDFFLELGEAPFRGEQIFRWLHKEGARSYDQMTDISKGLRERLSEELPLSLPLVVIDAVKSRDGSVKLVLETARGNPVESVLIPGTGADRRNYTLCVSTQSGCAVGCAFCETATMGYLQNLTAGQIAWQVTVALDWLAEHRRESLGALPREQWVTNIVYMGMGEPFLNLESVIRSIYLLTNPKGLNFSQRRITISTSGIIPGFARLAQESALRVNLAVSLNAPEQKLREQLMPISAKYPLDKLVRTLRDYPLPKRQRITIEYIMFDGINDSLDDAKRVAALLRGVRVKINLIPYNPGSLQKRVGKAPLMPSSPKTIERFAALLRGKGLAVTVRVSAGQDIGAACGQLAQQARQTKDGPIGETP